MQLFEERVIGFSCNEMIDEIHGGGKEGLDVGLSCSISDALGQEALSDAGIADEDDIFFLTDEVRRHKVKDSAFLFFPGAVEVEVELIDGGFFTKLGLLESQGDA